MSQESIRYHDDDIASVGSRNAPSGVCPHPSYFRVSMMPSSGISYSMPEEFLIITSTEYSSQGDQSHITETCGSGFRKHDTRALDLTWAQDPYDSRFRSLNFRSIEPHGSRTTRAPKHDEATSKVSIDLTSLVLAP